MVYAFIVKVDELEHAAHLSLTACATGKLLAAYKRSQNWLDVSTAVTGATNCMLNKQKLDFCFRYIPFLEC